MGQGAVHHGQGAPHTRWALEHVVEAVRTRVDENTKPLTNNEMPEYYRAERGETLSPTSLGVAPNTAYPGLAVSMSHGQADRFGPCGAVLQAISAPQSSRHANAIKSRQIVTLFVEAVGARFSFFANGGRALFCADLLSPRQGFRSRPSDDARAC